MSERLIDPDCRAEKHERRENGVRVAGCVGAPCECTCHDGDPLLWSEQAAELIGVSPGVFRKMHRLSKQAHRDGTATTSHLPPADEFVPRTVSRIGERDMQITRAPRWRESTLRAWLAQRPGRGRRGTPIGETK